MEEIEDAVSYEEDDDLDLFEEVDSTMLLLNHGGKCCGIKTVMGFDTNPNEMIGPIYKAHKFNDDDLCSNPPTITRPFFTDDAPPETRLERLDRYIAFVKKHRHQHIIEVTLCDAPLYAFMSQKKWFPLLEERGFNLSCKAKNSNSGNYVYVYHLVVDAPAPK